MEPPGHHYLPVDCVLNLDHTYPAHSTVLAHVPDIAVRPAGEISSHHKMLRIMNISPPHETLICSLHRSFHSTLILTIVIYKTLLLPAWSDWRTRRPSCVLCQVFIQFLALKFQVIWAILNLIHNKSSLGWQSMANTPWAFLLPTGLNWKKTHNLRRRKKCKACFWAVERAGSILGLTQWEICL